MEPKAPPSAGKAATKTPRGSARVLHIRNQPVTQPVVHVTSSDAPTPPALLSSPTSPTSPSGVSLAQYTALPALPPISPGRSLTTADVDAAVARHASYTTAIKDLVDQATAVKAVVDAELFGAEFSAGQAEIKGLRLALEDTQKALAREKAERKQEGTVATLRFGEEESEVARLREAFLAAQDEAEDCLAAAKNQHVIEIAAAKAKLATAHEEHASAQAMLQAQYEVQTQELLDHIEQLNAVLEVAQQQPRKRLSIAFDEHGNRQIFQNEP